MKFYLQAFIHCHDSSEQLGLEGDTGLDSVSAPAWAPSAIQDAVTEPRLSFGANRGNKGAMGQLCFSGEQLEARSSNSTRCLF